MTPSPFTIRAARAGDRDFVLGLVPRLRAFGSVARLSPEALDAGEQRAIERYFEDPPEISCLIVAESGDGTLLGAAYAERAVDYFTQEHHGHLGILAVTDEAQGRGVGRALIEAVEVWAREQGFGFVTLNVFTGNTGAIAAYERAGYRAEAVRYVKEL